MSIDVNDPFMKDFVPFKKQVNLAIPQSDNIESSDQEDPYIDSFIPKRSSTQSVARNIGRTAKSAGSTYAGIPGDIQDLALSLTSKMFGVNPEEVKRKLSSLSESDENIPSLAPTSQELKKTVEHISPSLKAQTPGEEKYEEGVELFSSLLGPGTGRSIANKVIRSAIGTAAGMGSKESLKELGYSPETQQGAKLISSILPMIAGGSLKLSPKETKSIYEAGKKAGLTEEQLAPLMQSEKRVASLSKGLAETPEKRNFIQSISDTIGDFYEKTKQSGRQVAINDSQLTKLRTKVSDLLTDLEQTIEPSAQKKQAIEYIRKSLPSLEKDVTAEKLINWWQDINAEVGQVKGAKKSINALKEPIREAFNEANPKLAKEFQQANMLWEKRSKFLDSLGWEKLENASNSKSLPLKLMGMFAAGHLGGLEGAAGITAAFMAQPVFKKISEKLLFDPSWQNIKKNMALSLTKESPKAALITYNQIKEKTKEELPKEYKKINWPK